MTMDINKWLLQEKEVKTNFSVTVNELLSLYVRGLHDFFETEYTENINVFFDKVDSAVTKKSDRMFLDWLRDQGIYQMKKILQLDIPFDDTVLAKLEFIKSILLDELACELRDKKSTRACIVNTLTNLNEQIIQLSNISMQKEELPIQRSLKDDSYTIKD